ncbi:ankyrin repeat domain-containing protein [Sphingomonas abietis]|uniref:Ankyrin repeat domain-containing protein n=1 Tax=Sphingomonas abietis TaxID=3012344 RepID=A0ABY7NM55_9SPHN|nr:ankyrin repeat domain-containing protein [Sphingomonas abietis]WBO22598.1 ankyrin repeat domain-containing protein [Sphingomonas abietis]
MKRGVRIFTVAGLMLAGIAAPALSQGLTSSGYDFIKAVKDRDGNKVTAALSTPGNTIITVRDTNGDSALHIVTKGRDLTWIQFMLFKGAPIDGRDRDGNTALVDAARLGFVDGEQQLLQAGAQVDLANNQGETALIIATQAHDLASVRLLVAGGADPRVTDHVAGMSALDYATRDDRAGPILKMLQDVKPVVKKQVSGPTLN